jgi:formylglycine-generating enzyme required for sulfatase activity
MIPVVEVYPNVWEWCEQLKRNSPTQRQKENAAATTNDAQSKHFNHQAALDTNLDTLFFLTMITSLQ